jgi:hypothetical protein
MQKLPKALSLPDSRGFSATKARRSPKPPRRLRRRPRPNPPRAHLHGKVALYSEYEYRGISQTSEKPALQLNLDYAHASGFYLGTFLTNIKWLKDAAEVAASARARTSSGISTAATNSRW